MICPFLTGRPIDPGFYWYITKRKRTIYELFEAFNYERDTLELVARSPGSYRTRPIGNWSGQWAGPLPEPEIAPC